MEQKLKTIFYAMGAMILAPQTLSAQSVNIEGRREAAGNHQSASPEFRGLGFPDQYHACGSRQISDIRRWFEY